MGGVEGCGGQLGRGVGVGHVEGGRGVGVGVRGGVWGARAWELCPPLSSERSPSVMEDGQSLLSNCQIS